MLNQIMLSFGFFALNQNALRSLAHPKVYKLLNYTIDEQPICIGV